MRLDHSSSEWDSSLRYQWHDYPKLSGNKYFNRKGTLRTAERKAAQNRRTQTLHGGQGFLRKCEQNQSLKDVILFPYVFAKMLGTLNDVVFTNH